MRRILTFLLLFSPLWPAHASFEDVGEELELARQTVQDAHEALAAGAQKGTTNKGPAIADYGAKKVSEAYDPFKYWNPYGSPFSEAPEKQASESVKPEQKTSKWTKSPLVAAGITAMIFLFLGALHLSLNSKVKKTY